MPTTRSQIAALPTCAGRKRKATETSQPAKKAKKIKTGQSADETYLQQVIQECTRQLRTYPKRVQRREIVENSLKYFRRFELAKQGDAIFFDDAAEARNLLASNKAIDRPVFVRDGANWSLIDRESSRRPIEQIFDFLNDPEERVEFPDQSKPSGSKYETMRVGDLKKRFLEPRDSVPRYPRNFRDIVTPLPDCGIPQFMQSAQCMLLHDIMRRQLDRDRLCGCLKGAETTRRSSCAHRRSTDDHLALADIWDFFKGTLMLSEPGSITYPHWDKFSTSTWISCIESEIGFGWLVDPSKEENTAWLDDVAEPKGRADSLRCLRNLKVELGYAQDDELEEAPYVPVIPAMVQGLFHLINAAIREGNSELYGGKQKIKQMVKVARDIDDIIEKMRRESKDYR